MEGSVKFKAFGHPNVSATHETTLMITKDDYLTPRGDCIVAINAEMALADFDPSVVRAAQREKSKIILSLTTSECHLEVVGEGHPDLNYSDERDIVVRKSTYTDGRTLMINADKAAVDLSEDIVNALKDHKTEIVVKITVKTRS